MSDLVYSLKKEGSFENSLGTLDNFFKKTIHFTKKSKRKSFIPTCEEFCDCSLDYSSVNVQ